MPSIKHRLHRQADAHGVRPALFLYAKVAITSHPARVWADADIRRCYASVMKKDDTCGIAFFCSPLAT